MNAARKNRWGHRDGTMVLVAYRHGLRVSELVDLRWDQVEFRTGTLHVRRVKQGTPSTHPILGGKLSWPSKRSRTCSGTPVVTRWPTRGTIPGRCKRTLVTETFSTPCGTQNCLR
jgi:integrase